MTTFVDSLSYYFVVWVQVYLFGVLCYKSVIGFLIRYNIWQPGVKLIDAYNLGWNLWTRFLSSIHASIIAYYALSIINNDYDLSPVNFSFRYSSSDFVHNILFFAFGRILPEGIVRFNTLTAFMVAYLSTDCIFMLIMRTEKDIKWTVVHHFTGGIGMFGFANGNRFHFNGLYYMVTEITTPFLNLSWAILHHKSQVTDLGKVILVFSGVITWFLFLLVRFLGAIWLFYMVYHNLHILLTYDHWEIIVAFTVNPLICGLNWWWFYKLTKIVFSKGK